MGDLELNRSYKLIDFLNKGVTTYHAVLNAEKILKENGFKKLVYSDLWDITEEFKGYVKYSDSSIFAFTLNRETIKQGFKFILAHLDSPSLKIKTGSDSLNSDGVLYLNVEVYGGPILNTWLDRGLSIAGKVYIKNKDLSIRSEIIDFKEEIAFIPNCPIHLNRDVNSGFELNKQRHLMPVVSANGATSLKDMIAKHLNVDKEEILDFDLYLYPVEEGKIVGFNKEFIQSRRIDDLAMCEASLISLVNSKSLCNKCVCLFDGEEIGSSISDGGDSNTFLNILNRIFSSLKVNEEERAISLYNSFMISADMAHAYNSNYSEKFDENNKCVINKGVVIKNNANKNYITTGETSSYFKSLCIKSKVPYQTYFNRSDLRGGSTLGPIVTKYLPVKGIDVGNAMFAMHSSRETAGVLDHYYISKVFDEYFK